ncbi:Cys-tRNA(Pro) deacylase [Acidaminobacterium chupaoyuni]
MAAALKTNVCRILDSAKVAYQTYQYDASDGAIDGESVAKKVGIDPRRMFKTLVTRGHSGNFCVFVLPVNRELDLKAAARAAGEKAVEMIHVSEINKVTGYIRGGCSPIGMKKLYKTVVDDSCRGFEAIVVSAGKIGAQVDIGVEALLKLTNAVTAAITAE